MANPERGEFEIEANGQKYIVAVKTAALIALQKRFSTPDHVADLQTDIFDKIKARSVEHLAAFFWAGLQKYHPEFDFDRTVALMDDCDEHQLTILFASALASVTPDPNDVKELARGRANPRKARAKRGTGGNGISGLAKSA